MNGKPKLRYRFVHKSILLYAYLSRFVPLRLWVFMGKYFGLIFYLLDFHHRNVALTNLRFVFENEKEEKEIRAIARRNFQQFGMIAHEWLRLKDLDIEEIKNLVRVEGKENLLAAKRKNRSVILLGAHFGNWEYAHLYYASQIHPLNFIVRAIDNSLLERERIAYNRHGGVTILYKENGLRTAIRNLRKGEDLVVFADRKADMKQGVPCQFFGKKALTITLVPALAEKFHIPIVPMFIMRCRDDLHHRLVFLPELELAYDEKEQAIHEGTQRQNDLIERVIRAYPEQWVWFHKRWKRFYPHLYPGELARRQRRKTKRRLSEARAS